MSRLAPRLRWAAVLLSAGLLAGCVSETPAPTAPPEPDASEAPTVVGDGTLRIGTLFALRDSASGAGQLAAVHAALREINIAGGALGQRVELISRDASADPADFDAAIAEFVDREVDAIIASPDSALALRAADLAAEAGTPVVALAPTGRAGSAQLFSAVPAADARVALLARLLPADGARRVALVHDDSAEGAVLAAGLGAALSGNGIDLVATRRIASAASAAPDSPGVAGTASALAAITSLDAVVVATGDAGDSTQEALAALAEVKLAGPRLWLVGATAADYADFPAGALEGAHAVTDGVLVDDEFRQALRRENPAVRSVTLAPEAYDAAVMIVLAARLADDDAGPALAAALAQLGADGVACRSFGECATVVGDGRIPSYEGRSGPFAIGATGARVSGGFSVGVYGVDNSVEDSSAEFG